MERSRRPELVVGLDIGQTCSAVAWSLGPDWCDPKNLNRWPGTHGEEKADKVVTRVAYRKSNHAVVNWGFECAFDDMEVVVREQFKLALDAEYEDDRGFDCEEAREWYLDYLRFLLVQIERFFDASIPRWRQLQVEYSFSMPTTWKNPAMIASMEELVKKAGFSKRGNRVRMALTEAEAAAIEASNSYCVGDTFMICDAGGGTTDLNIVRVKSVQPQIELEPLDHVEGEAIGSALIDFHMGQHILGRLDPIKEHLDCDVYVAVEEMLKGRFQNIKHSFPNPPVDEYLLNVPGFAGKQSFPEAGIRDSRMVISRTTLADIFDQQLERMFELIDARLSDLEKSHPNEQLTYIILSGGLGSSPHLHGQLRRRYEMNYQFVSRNTAKTRIMRVPEPQLAVVRGLVKERTQQLGTSPGQGEEVFRTRRCRNSYGVAIRLRYNGRDQHHAALPTVTGPDGSRWIEHVVDWFVRKGDEVDVNVGISKKYRCSIPLENSGQARYARIVMSGMPADRLPFRFNNDDTCKEVASVKYMLTENDMEMRNRQLWRLGKKYWQAEFDLVIKPGPADLRFQIVGKNGILSSNHDSLEIDYMDPSRGRDLTSTLDRHDSVDPIIEAKARSPGLRSSFFRFG